LPHHINAAISPQFVATAPSCFYFIAVSLFCGTSNRNPICMVDPMLFSYGISRWFHAKTPRGKDAKLALLSLLLCVKFS